jgi:DNA-binding MarR family transcriptional regulator
MLPVLPTADLIATVSLVGDAIDRHVVDRLAQGGFPHMGVGHGYVIQRLLTGPQQVTAMAADLGVTQQAISKTVKELVGLGLAAQSVDDADSRRRPVVLTDRGQAMVERTRAIRADLLDRLTGALAPRELSAAAKVLEVLSAELGLTERMRTRTVPAPRA